MNLRRILRLTPLYKKTYNCILQYNETKLLDHLKFVNTSIPYYKKRGSLSFIDCPVLRKDDVIGHERSFINDRYPLFSLVKSSTGGTSGKSLNLYRSYSDIIKELAYVDYVFSLIGNNLRVCVLRGNRPKKLIGNKKHGNLILSSYNLTRNNIVQYLRLIKAHNINCIHAYPSSLLIFLKLIKSLCLERELICIKGIVTSSEVMSYSDKLFVKSILPTTTLIDVYGQNEHVAFAISKDLGFYNFFNSYGYTEFIPVGNDDNGNIMAEIVSTGFNNDGMPFVRYGTEDFVMIDLNHKIVSIIGRSQDYLFGFDKKKLPCTILTRSKTLENVLCFQFFQEEYGKVQFRVVVNSNFSDEDINSILFDFRSTYGDKIQANVRVFPSLEKTNRGKLKRLIQNINN